MSTPSIKVGQGNWGIKATSLLGYANTDKKFVAREFTVGRLLDTATRVNASGNIQIVNANVPRIDYFGGQASLLVEPSAQNLLLQSQDFSTTWAPVTGGTGVNPSITTNAVISPDGTQNAERIVFNRGAGNASADQSTLQQNITIATSGSYILSVYAKASTAGDVGKQIFIRLGGAGGLVSVTLTANWIRYSQAESSVASGSQVVQIGNRGGFTADNSVSVDLWGAQAESGSVATSYIPTTTGTVTRNADVISVTGVAGLIGQTEGTIYAEINYDRTPTPKTAIMLINTDGDFPNRIQLYTDSSHQLNTIFSNASTAQTINASGTNIQNGINKIALTYTSSSAKLFLNGALQQSFVLTVFPVASLRVVKLGNNFNNASPIYNGLRAAALYTTMLSDAELQSLTTL